MKKTCLIATAVISIALAAPVAYAAGGQVRGENANGNTGLVDDPVDPPMIGPVQDPADAPPYEGPAPSIPLGEPSQHVYGQYYGQ